MNIILGILAICFCSYVGYNASLKYKKRFEFFNNFLIFNKKIKNDIAFSNVSLKSALKGDVSNDTFTCSIKEYIFDEKPFNGSCFTEEELNFINNYFKTIGKSDRQSQLKFLDEIDITLNKYYSDSQLEFKKYKSIYLKVGFLFGLMILIVLL